MILIKDLSIFNESQDLLILTISQLEISAQSILLIQGNSGTGKSMFLKTLANQHRFFAGNIIIKNKIFEAYTLQEFSKIIQFVNQNYVLFPHLTAYEQLIDPLCIIANKTKKEADEIVISYLDSLHLTAHKDKYPRELSGGQRQRIAIIQKLILEPDILLLDEPTSGLDQESKQLLISLLQKKNKKGLTIVVASHDSDVIDVFSRNTFKIT